MGFIKFILSILNSVYSSSADPNFFGSKQGEVTESPDEDPSVVKTKKASQNARKMQNAETYKKEYIDYLRSPQYQKVAKGFYTGDSSQFVEDQVKRLEGATLSSLSKQTREMEDVEGIAFVDENKAEVSGLSIDYNPRTSHIAKHELSHLNDQALLQRYGAVDPKNRAFKASEIPEDVKQLTVKWQEFARENLNKKAFKSQREKYLRDESEIRARVNVIRSEMINRGVDLNSSDNSLQRSIMSRDKSHKQVRDAWNDLESIMPKEAIFKAMREMAMNDTGRKRIHSFTDTTSSSA